MAQIVFAGSGTSTIANLDANFTELYGFSKNLVSDASGNVGVGLTPAVRLDVGTTAGGRIRFDTSNPAEIICTSSNFAGNVFSTLIFDAVTHVSRVSGTERMRLDSTGHLINIPGSNIPPTLTVNGQMNLTPTSNTNVRISFRGSDGITRTANITLA